MAKYKMDKLEALIHERYSTIRAFSKASGLEASTVSRLLDRGDWKISQMQAAAKALNIPDNELKAYFFTEESAKMHGGAS